MPNLVRAQSDLQDKIAYIHQMQHPCKSLTYSLSVIKIWFRLSIWLQFFFFMANIHPPILHNLLGKEMNFMSICHLPMPREIWASWSGGKQPLKFIMNRILLFYSHLSPPHLTVSSFIFHILQSPLVHLPYYLSFTIPTHSKYQKNYQEERTCSSSHKKFPFVPFTSTISESHLAECLTLML